MEYKPDILVIQECTYFEYVVVKKRAEFAYTDWYGDGKDSLLGIGIFSKSHRFQLASEHRYDAKFRYVVPYSLEANGKQIILFAVWTKGYISNDDLHKLAYDENIKAAWEFYRNVFKVPVIFIGDFNTFYNSKYEEGLSKLEKMLLPLVNCASESEKKKPTFYSPKYGPGVDDFCFASDKLAKKIFSVGNRDEWKKYSDHCPIIVEFDF
jgi:exonuclease III